MSDESALRQRTDHVNCELAPIEYRGELVALASARRFHVVAPWLAARTPGDPDLRFVAYMCLCYAEVAAGSLPAQFSSELAERWSRMALIDPNELVPALESDDALALRWNVPVEQVRMARADLSAD